MLHLINFNLDNIIKETLKYDYPVIGFSATTNQFPYIKAITRRLKEIGNKSFLICGGVHATLNPDDVISLDSLDAVCVGEGEGPLVDLCNCINNGKEIKNIPNLWIKDNDGIHKNLPRSLLSLNQLPFPDRDIFDYKNLLHERIGEASVMVSRGCPYACSYCCNSALRKIYGKLGKYVRFQPVDYAIEQLKDILQKYSFIKSFAFDDDILPLDKNWFEEFSTSYKKEVNLPFTCNIRPDLVNNKTMQLLKYAGCWRIHIGIESGNKRIRNNVLSRRISDEQIFNAISLAEYYGIKIYTYNMIGFPYERSRDILDTIKMNVSSSIEIPQVSVYYPYKHTALGEYCEQNSLISDINVSDYFAGTKLKFSKNHKMKLSFYGDHFTDFIIVYQKLKAIPYPLSRLLVILFDLIFSSLAGMYLFKLGLYLFKLGKWAIIKFHVLANLSKEK